MNIAVSHYSYFAAHRAGTMDIGGFIREAAKIGADGVELLSPLYRDPVADKLAAKSALAETGLPVPIFSVSNNFAKTSTTEREEQLDRIKFGIDEACDYGADVIRVFAGDVAEGVNFEEARQWIVEGLAQASTLARAAGVRLALENHGHLAGQGNQVTSLIADVRELAGNDALGANPDFGNFVLVDQDPALSVFEVASLAFMAHAKDFRAAAEGFTSIGGGTFAGTVIGEGSVPIRACLKALRGFGFKGWVSVEYEGSEDPVTAVPRSIANLRAMTQ